MVTVGIESVDSFVLLENQVGAREATTTAIPEESEELVADQTGEAGEDSELAAEMIDEEQQLIDEELEELRRRVSVPFLPPGD